MNTAQIIQELIALESADSSDPRPGSVWRRECAQQNYVLPVLVTWGGIYALRPTGEVVLFLEDAPNTAEKVEGHMVKVIRYHASKKFSRLSELAPTRGPQSRTCDTCQGSGERPAPYTLIPCACGGLGWVEE